VPVYSQTQLQLVIRILDSLNAKQRCLELNIYAVLKGTVPRDFSPQLFFMKNVSLGPD
jgi:hypothetical protein